MRVRVQHTLLLEEDLLRIIKFRIGDEDVRVRVAVIEVAREALWAGMTFAMKTNNTNTIENNTTKEAVGNLRAHDDSYL